MAQKPLLRCETCGKLTQQESGAIDRCPERPERGAVHQFEVVNA